MMAVQRLDLGQSGLCATTFAEVGRLILNNWVWTLVFIVLGLVLVLLSKDEYFATTFFGFDVQVSLSTVGTFFVFSSLVSFYFENRSKRKMFEEVFEKVVGSSNVAKSGLVDCFENSRDLNYADDLRKAKSLKIFFSYSADFLKRYSVEIDELINRGGGVELVFLDRESPVMQCMHDLGWQKPSIQSGYETIDSFCAERERCEKLSIRFVSAMPRYSAIIFDSHMYVIENTLSAVRQPVPVSRIERGGYLYDFYLQDLMKATEMARDDG